MSLHFTLNICYRRQLQWLSPSSPSSRDQQALTLMASTCSSPQRQLMLTGQFQASILVVCRWVNIFIIMSSCVNPSKPKWQHFNRHQNKPDHCELVCVLQDPPGIQLYVTVKVVMLHGVRLNKYRCRRGSNSLEGLHAHLYNAIPSQRCGIMQFQVSNNNDTSHLPDISHRWEKDLNNLYIREDWQATRLRLSFIVITQITQQCTWNEISLHWLPGL